MHCKTFKYQQVSKKKFYEYVTESDLEERKGGYNNPRDIFVNKATGLIKAVKEYKALGHCTPFAFHGWNDSEHSPSYYL